MDSLREGNSNCGHLDIIITILRITVNCRSHQSGHTQRGNIWFMSYGMKSDNSPHNEDYSLDRLEERVSTSVNWFRSCHQPWADAIYHRSWLFSGFWCAPDFEQGHFLRQVWTLWHRQLLLRVACRSSCCCRLFYQNTIRWNQLIER